MKSNRTLIGLLVVASAHLVLALPAWAEAGWRAGTAKACITPTEKLWMAGFSNRTNPSSGGKLMDLWIKALALEDAKGRRAVILTSDLLGIPQNIYQHTTSAIREKYGLRPDQILLSASHTHCGPVLRNALYDIYPLDEAQHRLIEQYSTQLESQIVEAVGRSLAALAPARVVSGQGTTGFAVNRRINHEAEVPQDLLAGTLQGPVDHAVPVLAVYQPEGQLLAVLFGYACHNTTLQVYEWSGDYAGFAQIALEKSHPGAQAMFFMGCGGDQNPLPRHDRVLAERYGYMLAAAVEEVLIRPPHNLSPELVTRMKMLPLDLGAPLTVAELEKLKTDHEAPTRRWATRWLANLKSGMTPVREYSYPVQAWRLGGEQLLITLGGEPVVDYANKFKQTFGANTWVAGYCNDVMAYMPSRRVLEEDRETKPGQRWGYEGSYNFVVYGLPAKRWADNVEDAITTGVRQVVKETEMDEKIATN